VHRPALHTIAISGLLVFVTMPGVRSSLGAEPEAVIASLREARLNTRDQELAERGYYEGLMDAGSFTSQLWVAHMGKPRGVEWENVRAANVSQPTGDFLEYEFKHSYIGTWKDAPFRTNSQGFRGREFEQTAPQGTLRIALVGASYEVGAGVDDDEIFPVLIENTLNREYAGKTYANYEILNCSVGGYGMVQRTLLLEQKVMQFRPNVVLLTVYPTEETRLLNHLVNMTIAERITEPFLRDLVERAGATPTMTKEALREKLRPFGDEIVDWCFRQCAATCRAQDTPLFCIFLTTAGEPHMAGSGTHRPAGRSSGDEQYLDRLWRLAADASIPSLRLSHDELYGGYDHAELELAPWDFHMNTTGHQVVADGLCRLFRNNEAMLHFGLGGD